MRVLIVGGAGYIGAITAKVLVDRGHAVVVYDDLSTGHRAACAGPLIEGDIRDGARMESVLGGGGFDGVLHFAAWALVGESMTRPIDYYDNNVGGTLTLVRAMARAGVQNLVFSSSCSIYGTPVALPIDEAHPRRPESVYGSSKDMVETILAAARAGEGFRATTLRYFNAAGAFPDAGLGESHAQETHLIPLALQTALGRRGPLTVFGDDYDTRDGTCVRDYVHVLDLADAHVAALEKLQAGSPGDAFNLGTGVGSTVREVLDAVRDVAGKPVSHTVGPRRPGDPAAAYADYSKAQAGLGWSPQRSLHDAVRSAHEWEMSRRY